MTTTAFIEPLDGDQRWWRVGNREIDLRADDSTFVPPFYNAAILAVKYRETEEDDDVAALCEWIVSDHTPTDANGCTQCATTKPCDMQAGADLAVLQWLQRRTMARYAQTSARLGGAHG